MEIFTIILKIVLSVLFFLCLLKMPYGFYQLIRFTAMAGFAILAYHAYKRPDKTEMIIYVCLAILFQPLIKISLGRNIWNIVDIIAGIGLIISIIIDKKSHQNSISNQGGDK